MPHIYYPLRRLGQEDDSEFQACLNYMMSSIDGASEQDCLITNKQTRQASKLAQWAKTLATQAS